MAGSLLLSAGAHVAALLVMGLLSLVFQGGKFGERGFEGAGGDEVTIEVAAGLPGIPEPDPALQEPEAEARQPAAESVREEAPAAPVPRAEAVSPSDPAESVLGESASSPDPPPERERAPERETAREVPVPEDIAGWLTGRGGDSEATESGRAVGDPAGGRDDVIGAAAGRGELQDTAAALAPEGTFCDDPIAGTWVTAKYKPGVAVGRWVRFTLRIVREGSRLSGRVVSRIWDGGPGDNVPPFERAGRCPPFHSDMTWVMPATGTLLGTQVRFDAGRERVAQRPCPGPGSYAPDHFSGTVDPQRERLRARNNDGAFDVNEPYIFRRTACE